MKTVASKWGPAQSVWNNFCQSPESDGQSLGLIGNENSFINFYRKHGKRLEELGVTRRSPVNRRIVADSERFGPVVFALLTLGYVPDDLLTLGHLPQEDSNAAA